MSETTCLAMRASADGQTMDCGHSGPDVSMTEDPRGSRDNLPCWVCPDCLAHLWTVTDGQGGEVIVEADTITEAVEVAPDAWMQGLDPVTHTTWWHLSVYPADPSLSIARRRMMWQDVTVTQEPAEPDCTGTAHDWRESPARCHGGGVVYDETCRVCGAVRTVDTWAEDPETGEQGLGSVTYHMGDDTDEEA